MQSAALGADPPLWVKKYAVDNLRFVEFERKALPCALLRSKDGSKSLYTFSAADMDARSVMEQRLQSMVCCFSLVQQVILRNHLHRDAAASMPLVPYLPGAAVGHVWDKLLVIPKLLSEHLLAPAQFAMKTVNLTALQNLTKVDTTRTVSSPSSAASSKENAPQAKQATKGAAEAAPAVIDPAQLEKTLEQKRAVVQLLQTVIAEVEAILSVKPAGLVKLRESCLAMRTALQKIESLSSAKARWVSFSLRNHTSSLVVIFVA